MAMTATVKKRVSSFGKGHGVVILRGTIAFSGSYATGGETWSLIAFAGAPVKLTDDAIVGIWGSSGYNYGWVPGANLSNGKILIRTGTTELSAGAYPGGITGDTVQFEVVLPSAV